MNIPPQIKIGGHTFDIFIEPGNQHARLAMGNASPSMNKIFVDSASPRSQQESTFLHEIIEVINWNLKIGLKEEAICRLEAALYQVFADNREIFKP